MSTVQETAGPLVLIVEDDPQVRRFLRTSLPAAGFRWIEASTGAEALRLAAQYVPDVVLLDLGLPDMEGREIALALRKWSAVPILVLSARGQEREKVELLDSGADDYLTKPFGFDELVARIRSALRRVARAATDTGAGVFVCGPLALDLAARRVHLDGREIHLTPIEFKVLATLAAHPGRILTKQQLLVEVWGPQNAEQGQYLRVYMTHLRRKLEPVGKRILRTEAGVGYGLECPEPAEEGLAVAPESRLASPPTVRGQTTRAESSAVGDALGAQEDAPAPGADHPTS
jgi:two-component system KDP operon response regulator KdpE